MLKASRDADVFFFGEKHNDPIVHWLQLRFAKDLYGRDSSLTVGMEMFEADGQVILDEYFGGFISEKSFEKEARLWPNYDTDYKPVLDFAKEEGLRLVATNVPRRYASSVYKRGFDVLDSLPAASKKFLPPLPVAYDPDLPGYKKMLEMGGKHANPNLPKAQAIKDATMAYFISRNIKLGTPFLHLNGSYHSDNDEGILWYLRRYDPELRFFTISTVTQDQLDKLDEEYIGKADFILCVPTDMTKTR
ncbi:ChaN family lipoprotein [Fulvitalea axinellae]